MPDRKFPSPEEFLEGQLLAHRTNPCAMDLFHGRFSLFSSLPQTLHRSKEDQGGSCGYTRPIGHRPFVGLHGQKDQRDRTVHGAPHRQYAGRIQLGATRPSSRPGARCSGSSRRFETGGLTEEVIERSHARFLRRIEQSASRVFASLRFRAKRSDESARKG